MSYEAYDTPRGVHLGLGKTFVTYMRNFPFFLSHKNTATFAKVSRKSLAAQHYSDFTTLFTPDHIRILIESVFWWWFHTKAQQSEGGVILVTAYSVSKPRGPRP